MIEDVKLMADFMGIKWPETKPDYPKDMNALLGVMDKLDDDHKIITDISGDEWSIIIWERGEGRICDGDFEGYTDLPSVLFPLLVEAIKQIKESE